MKYHLLPGQYLDTDGGLQIHNLAFSAWAKCWSEVLANLPEPSLLNADEFRRQNYIGLILSEGGSIAGLHLSSLFNLAANADQAHSYFTKNYHPEFLRSLIQAGHQWILTFEYLTVFKGFSREVLGYSLSSLLLGLGHRLQKEVGACAMVAPVRCDFKVDEMAKPFGAYPLTEPGLHHGVPTINIVNPTSNLQEPPFLKGRIQDLWGHRNDWSERMQFQRKVA